MIKRKIFDIDYHSPFMLNVVDAKTTAINDIPAVVHVDNTCRVQTVKKEENLHFFNLITKFKEITGVPILLNTSFNENEPIVLNPQEVIDCFVRTKMDFLVMENWLYLDENFSHCWGNIKKNNSIVSVSKILTSYEKSKKSKIIIPQNNILYSKKIKQIKQIKIFKNIFKYKSEVYKFLDYNQPDIIHIHGLWRPIHLIFIIVSLQLNIPIIIQPHGMLLDEAIKTNLNLHI